MSLAGARRRKLVFALPHPTRPIPADRFGHAVRPGRASVDGVAVSDDEDKTNA